MNYRKTSDECRKAWFKYKEELKIQGQNPSPSSLVSFVAGWNAAKNSVDTGK